MKPQYIKYGELLAKALIEENEDDYWEIENKAWNSLKGDEYDMYQEYCNEMLVKHNERVK